MLVEQPLVLPGSAYNLDVKCGLEIKFILKGDGVTTGTGSVIHRLGRKEVSG